MKTFLDYFINAILLIGVFMAVSYCAKNSKLAKIDHSTVIK